ncbi:MAG: LysR family transcriptional regulator, partial [Gemmatimonadaceae bacterium]
MMRAAMAVQLRHLRYFAVVAETRNLSRAAAQLRVAQPAISRQMHDLERVLDVPLFVRHTKGVALTAAGDALADSVRQILADIGTAIERADATAAGRHGRVVLGANRAFVAAGFTTTVQEELRREHPELTLAVQDFDPPELTDRLHAGVVDLALALTDIPDAALESATLWDEIADRALVPTGHPLARRRSVTVAELGALPVVVARHGYPAALLERALATLRAHGLASPVVVVDAGLQAAHIAVATGRGWTLISRARALAPPEGTVAVPMAGFELILTGAVAWRRTEHRPVVRTVLEKVMEVARRHPNARAPTEPLRLPRPVASRAERRRDPGAVPLALELRHLRALREVAGAQTIGRAAERLGMTQPSLSRQLKELEQAVGVPLLERSARGVRVTAAGASLAGDCLALLLAVERLSHDATRVRRSME